MTHPNIDDWDDGKIVLTIEGERYTAFCSSEVDGRVFVGENCVSEGSVLDKNGAPFPFDIVFHKFYPAEGEVERISEELGEQFADQFDNRVSEVYELIEGADDPIDAVENLDPDNLFQN